MDFPDCGVLGYQGTVAALDLGDVADEYRGTRTGAIHYQRERSQQHSGTPGVHLQPHALAAAQQVLHVLGHLLRIEGVRDQRPSDFDEIAALQFGAQTHPVEGR